MGLRATAHRVDDALVRSARRDPCAFEAIVRAYQGMVFSLASHFLRDTGAAEDLAQEVFLQLYAALDDVQSAAHLQSWLRKVTCHRCVDYGRRHRLEPRLRLDDIREPSVPAPEGDLLQREILRRLVKSLPERARAVVLLRYQEEMELHEIAQVLKIPINTVKSSLQRALSVLRGKLERVGGVRV